MKHKFTFLLMLAMIFAVLNVSAQFPNSVYVSAASGNDANNGTSAATPFKTLRKALEGVRGTNNVQELNVLVEKGTYYPYDESLPATEDVRDATFTLSRPEGIGVSGKRLRVLGGYDFSTMTRDIANNPTILNGGGRVSHVVVVGNVTTLSDSLEISGFTITGAFSTSSLNVTYNPGSIVLNRAYGGGMAVINCSNNKILIRNCAFLHNTSYNGGGIFVQDANNLVVSNCVFDDNQVVFSQSLVDEDGKPVAAGYGGAVSILSSNGFNVKLLGCVFYKNKAFYGPAIKANGTDYTLTISNCSFVRNITENGSFPWAIMSDAASVRVELTNSVFWKNTGALLGYGNLNVAGSHFITQNQFESPPDQELTDVSATIYTSANPSPFKDDNNGAGADGNWMTGDDGLQLNTCIENWSLEAGGNSYPGASLATDITGRPRISGEYIDRGAYEDQFASVNLYPDADGDGYGDATGTSIHNCTLPTGYTLNNDDCNDNDNTVYPGAPELCDGKDNDCDNSIDEDVIKTKYYLDADGDGFGKTEDVIGSCIPVEGRVTKPGDCNDNDNTIYPGAREICGDGKDNNCNPFDEAILTLNFPDNDGDGYGDPNGQGRLFCGQEPGYSLNNLDCDDHDKDIHPGAPELCDGKDNNCNSVVDDGVSANYYLDADSDGYGKTSDVISSCIPVAGRVTQAGDCDDNDNTVHPGAPDICDGKDNDCNGYIDEDLSLHTKYYRDVDGDGFGNGLDFLFNCGPLQGRVTKDGDCNDNDNTIYPGAPELCDGRDNNCDGQTDENLTKTTYYIDLDGDGYGNTSSAVQRCVALSQWVTKGGDCDDNDNAIHPGASELCDGKDNNCNGNVDENISKVNYYLDADGDGYGKTSDVVKSCIPVSGRVIRGGDCNDNDKTIYPNAPEICDNKDNDCDGRTDENITKVNYYRDADGDGYGKTSDVILSCGPVAGRVTKNGDCNDNDNTIYPNAPEICDGKDNDCDGRTDENITKVNYYRDADGDGFGKNSDVVASCTPIAGRVTKNGDCNDNDNTIYPDAPEICDGKDNDCDGRTDEGLTKTNYYLDADGDGFGKNSDVVASCTPITGRVTKNGDCNDNDRFTYPGAPEICDGKDNDCDGKIEESRNYYRDVDGDGYGRNSDVIVSCLPIGGRITRGGDCNDNDKTIYPGAAELCDNKDNDCDGQIDEGIKVNYYRDGDGDGFGNPNNVIISCTPVAGRVTKSGDCNDNDKTIYTGAPEICDNKDNDCDGQIDEGITKVNYYRDADNDGYGRSNDVVQSCMPVAGRVTKSGDCNDDDRTINPGATEMPGNGKDDNCNGQTDEGCGNLSNLTEAGITKTSALLKWTATINPAQLQIRYRQYNASQWIVLNAFDGRASTLQLTGLKCNTKYEWSIRAYCNKAWKDYSDKKSFTTSSCSSTATRSATADESNEEVRKVQVETKVWPNPTHGSFMLSVNLGKAETQTASIKIIDLSGRVIYHENTAIPNGRLQKQMNMPVGLSAGVYVVVITTQNNNQQFKIEYLK